MHTKQYKTLVLYFFQIICKERNKNLLLFYVVSSKSLMKVNGFFVVQHFTRQIRCQRAANVIKERKVFTFKICVL